MKLTPLKINLLLHIYALAEPFNHPDAPAYVSAKEEMIVNKLICHDSLAACGYRITSRGAVLINMLLETPLPESGGWYDPRTKEA